MSQILIGFVKELQKALADAGFDPGPIDGDMGPSTELAIAQFKKAHGLADRPQLGPITLRLLFTKSDVPKVPQLPWIIEIAKYMGFHEVTNNKALREWLKSDGQTLGDPSVLPWCGDAVETSIRLALPDEWAVTDPVLKSNPYWADNWRKFGKESVEAFGAVATFSRPGGNHVAFLMGVDRKNKRYRVRGGNQSNRVSDTWIDMSRLTSIRRPSTWLPTLPKLPEMDSTGQIVSQNEA